MVTIRKAEERGVTDLEWLKSWHTFSFNQYYDSKYMHFSHLRVMNDDIVKPGEGFGYHAHNDMEIITFIIDGAIEHKDSMGNKAVIRRGEVQKMTAGTGVMHSEFNASEDKELHLYQIWVFPDKKGLTPSYEQKTIDFEKSKKGFQLLASNQQVNGEIKIHQDAKMYHALVEPSQEISMDVDISRSIWLQAVNGTVEVNGYKLSGGDGAAIVNESRISVTGKSDAEVLLFDLK